MALNTKIEVIRVRIPDVPYTSYREMLLNNTLLDRDLVLSLRAGDILHHGGYKLKIQSKEFVTSGAGNLAAVLIVTDETT